MRSGLPRTFWLALARRMRVRQIFLDKLQPTIRKVVAILENMIDPPDEAWDFLEIWENSPEIIAEVERQIAELKAYLG